jgi:hypothetical protein
MKLRTLIISSVFTLSFNAIAAVQVAPASRVNLFLDSTSPFVSADWTVGSTPSLGSLKILRSTANTKYFLLLNFPTNVGISGSKKRFLLDSITNVGATHTRISDTFNSYTGQCADFAKSMIGSTDGTSTWHAGTKLGDIPNTQLTSQLVPGTMIAYFNGSSIYPSNGTGHVAIVLSVAKDAAGNPTGVNVVDQNFLVSPTVVTANGTSGSAPQTISKHFLKWTDGTSGLRSASKYHIVDLY